MRQPQGQQRPQRAPPQPPFQPAFGSLMETYYKACDLWELCRASPTARSQNLAYLNATIERIIFFGGVPSETMRDASIPFPDDLIKSYEVAQDTQIKEDLAKAKDKTEKDEKLAAWRDEFLFRALTDILRAIKEFLSNNNLLHEELIVVKHKHGYSYFS